MKWKNQMIDNISGSILALKILDEVHKNTK